MNTEHCTQKTWPNWVQNYPGSFLVTIHSAHYNMYKTQNIHMQYIMKCQLVQKSIFKDHIIWFIICCSSWSTFSSAWEHFQQVYYNHFAEINWHHWEKIKRVAWTVLKVWWLIFSNIFIKKSQLHLFSW